MAGLREGPRQPRKRFWRGQPKTRPFQLYVKPDGGMPITLDGTMLQESILPPWFMKALLALIALLVVLVLIWLLLLKPSIQTAASEAVASPLASLKADVNDALGAAGLPTMPAEAAPSAARRRRDPDARASAVPAPAPGASAAADARPRRRRASSSRASATRSTAASTEGPDLRRSTGTLFVTDFVFSNPNGAEGASWSFATATR